MAKEKWTRESVEKEARKYSVKWHFATHCSGGFKYAVRHDFIKDYYWFEAKSKPMGYWTKERCEEESRKYKSRTEYKEKAGGAYETSRVNGWLDDYIWLENKNIFRDKVDYIYGYFFENNTVYIGRTLNPSDRDRNHRNPHKNDSVYRYAKEYDTPIPKMSIIESHLTINDGKKREQFWIEYYQNKGYNVLNKVKGGGIGSLSFVRYKKEEIISEGKKYSNRTEFKEKSPSYYYQAYKQGLLNEIIPSNQIYKRGFWKDRKHVEEKSKEYKTLKEFTKKSKGAYDAAVKGGYLKELVWLERERKIYKPKSQKMINEYL